MRLDLAPWSGAAYFGNIRTVYLTKFEKLGPRLSAVLWASRLALPTGFLLIFAYMAYRWPR